MRLMKVDKLGIDLITRDPVVILKDEVSKRYLPILIGPFEATAIALALEGATIPRPLSHDLMRNIIEALNAKVLRIVISDVQENTFFARIILEANGKNIEIDARPSDSIALALRTDAPIFVSEKIILEEAVMDKTSEDKDQKKFKEYLEKLKPGDFLKGLKPPQKEKNKDKDKKDDKNKKNKDNKKDKDDK